MSLLLDALQRASKEKEKLAESRAAGGEASSTAMPESREPLPTIEMDREPEAESRSTLPELSIEPLQPKNESSTPRRNVSIDPVVTATEEGIDASPHATDIVADPPEAKTAIAFTHERETSSPKGTPARSSDMEMLAAMTAPSSGVGGVASDDRTAGVSSRNSEPAEAPLLRASPKAQGPAVKEARPAEISPDVAREILGVSAKPKAQPRTLALVALALVVIAGYGAFWFGAFDRLLGSSSSSLTPQNPPPPAVVAETQAAAAAPVPPENTAAKPNSSANSPPGEVKAAAKGIGDEKTAKRPQEVAPGGDTLAESARSSQRGTLRSASSSVKPVVVTRASQPADLDLAYAALGEGRLEDARKYYRKALERNSGERDALLGMAYISHREGDNDSARSNYQQVLRLDPNNAVATTGLLAIAADGDLALSAARAREFAERVPDSAPALANLGAMLAREGRIGEAQQAYFKALTLEPDNPLHAFNVAVALDRLHKYSQAEAFYEKALKLAEKANAAEKAGLPVQVARQRLDEIRKGAAVGGSPSAASAR